MSRNDKYNASGCKDLTSFEALNNIEREEQVSKLIRTIFYICDLAGFRVEGRIALQDKKTGKVWR